jgi:2-polyprenyl-6-hydroxyphenyl methylase / 3-demethylubiquinone-9 3-methyltransferase
MEKIPDHIYRQINNSIYNSELMKWWDKDSPFNLLESILNPVRLSYFKRILNEIRLETFSQKALEVGCGGGILSESIAKMGFITTGLDPSERSIECAREHSIKEGLSITYVTGYGEEIPFQDNSFEVIFCCDVLEHVRDLPKVISEIARVLKQGGIFFYDTMNRTFLSKTIVIKIMQEWEYFAVLPDNLHVWKMFIRPDEIKKMLFSHGLNWIEHRGINTQDSNLGILRSLHRRASGKLSCEEFSWQCRLRESNFLWVAYMGYAIKK